MKKDKNAEKIGKNATRPERWGVHARAYLAKMRGSKAVIPLEWLEEAEGRPLDEVVVDALIERRGWGAANPTREQKWRLEEDAEYEAAGTRSRNANEDSIVRQECLAMIYLHANYVDREDLHALIKGFYHAGDRGLDAAINRAVKFALAKLAD